MENEISRVWSESCIYKQRAPEMNDFIEHRNEDQFAKGQSYRDLRVSPELRRQLMEAIDSRGACAGFLAARNCV